VDDRRGQRRHRGRAAKGAFVPFRPTLPLDLEIDFVNAACADAAELVPGTSGAGG
jgi:D-aminopeptidase